MHRVFHEFWFEYDWKQGVSLQLSAGTFQDSGLVAFVVSQKVKQQVSFTLSFARTVALGLKV